MNFFSYFIITTLDCVNEDINGQERCDRFIAFEHYGIDMREL